MARRKVGEERLNFPSVLLPLSKSLVLLLVWGFLWFFFFFSLFLFIKIYSQELL